MRILQLDITLYSLKKQAEKLNFYIIIPAHNEEKNIAQTLQSIVNQKLKPKKLVVVNDNSSDNTRQIINDYTKRFDWIYKVENKSS